MYDTTKPHNKEISKLVKETWETPYVSIKDGIAQRKFQYPDCTSVDGIGTKGIYHWKQRSFRNAVLDALAMNLNDLALERAVPFELTNHLFLPEDDQDAVLNILYHLIRECRYRDIAVKGGETAIHNDMNGLELSVAISGFVKEQKPNQFKIGDILIGIESNGLHSNGFTKIRKLFGGEYRKEFIDPTYIYSDTILKLNERYDIHGMMNITGGAFTKLKRTLKEGEVIITRYHRLNPQEIFFDAYEKGVPDEEMYRTFNCGVGFVLSVSEEDSTKVLREIRDLNSDIIGKVIPGDGQIKIQSKFSDEEVVY
ncbi:hypothetical protein HYX17_04165 [Candidatus Woesearchaeota archaeon]|nr:hypothetical protein [Candidatus Woesearchaeota archaeon]